MRILSLTQLLCVVCIVTIASAAWAQSSCAAGAAQCKEQPAVKSAAQTSNILGGALTICSRDPMTGWFRDGACKTNAQDRGRHVVCAVMTEAFLAFTRSRGNDLSTPSVQFGFPGLKPNDRWCLCALRWREAQEAGVAPPVVVAATHKKALNYVRKPTLLKHRLNASAASRNTKE